MLSCPKCRYHGIRGPIYVKGRYGSECLRYSCYRCGYSESRPTADSGASANEWADAISKHAPADTSPVGECRRPLEPKAEG